MNCRLASLILLALLAFSVPVSAAAKKISVVTSIRPLHSLVAAVMKGQGAPYLIVRGASSPHSFAMKASDARALQNADVIFWVGDNLESFLGKAIPALAPQALAASLAWSPNLVRYPLRESGVWEAPEHRAEPPAAALDPHIWLDPQNAISMVHEIARILSLADPENASRYNKNAAATIERLQRLHRNIANQLSAVRDRAYIQVHDAFQYLERRYALNAVAAITPDPERQIGARRIGEIRNRISGTNVVCIFAEPQFDPKLVEIVTEGFDVKNAVLDPIGADINAGPDLYFTLMRRNTDTLKSCLDIAG